MKILITGIVIIIISTACSDNKINNTLEINDFKTLFPLSLNYEYEYMTYLTKDFGKTITDSLGLFNGSVYKKENYYNKEAFFINIKDPFGNSLVDQIYSLENQELYMFSNYINYFITDIENQFNTSLPLKLKDQWLLVADIKKDKWDILKQDVDGIILNSDNRLVGQISMYGEKGSSEILSLKQNTYNSQEFSITFEFKGLVFESLRNDTNEVSFEVKYHTVFGVNAGILKSYVDPTYIDLYFLGLPFGEFIDLTKSFKI